MARILRQIFVTCPTRVCFGNPTSVVVKATDERTVRRAQGCSGLIEGGRSAKEARVGAAGLCRWRLNASVAWIDLHAGRRDGRFLHRRRGANRRGARPALTLIAALCLIVRDR